MAIAFEAYTEGGRLDGRVVADERLADLLATFTSIVVEQPHLMPIADESGAPGIDPAPTWSSVDVDDLLIVATGGESIVPFHAAWHAVRLLVGPYVVEGEMPSLPGFDPGRALARPTGAFVLLGHVQVFLAAAGWTAPAGVVRELPYAWVNRYSVERVESALELSRFFPGAFCETTSDLALTR